jgi:carbon storage regulator
MLVLTRKPGDGIVIGDDIIIKIIEIKGGGIRVGIDAPLDKKIYRQEVYDRISLQNREALQWDMTDLDTLSDNLALGKKQK